MGRSLSHICKLFFKFQIAGQDQIQLRVRLCHKSERETFRPVCTRTTDGWTAEYRIPLSFLRILYPEFSLRSGVSFRANCYKCGDKTVHPHFLAWNAVETAAPDFHRPEFFGKMILA